MAVLRGVEVIVFTTWGFNDRTERLPRQGGKNKSVYGRLLKWAHKKKCQKLKLAFYVPKGRTAYIHNMHCHAKFMVVDDQITIFGNGNQDTQSWYHSQELNVMADSADLAKEWMELYRRNQSTFQYGWVHTAEEVLHGPHPEEADLERNPTGGPVNVGNEIPGYPSGINSH